MSDSDIVQDFLVESYENLDRLDRELVGLETNPYDADALAGVFRTIHTIKGTCGFLGFNKLEAVTHVGENLLARLRDRQLALTPEIITALLSMVDAVRQMLNEIENSGKEGERDDSPLISNLTQLQQPNEAVSKIGDLLIKRTAATQQDIQLAARRQAEGDPRRLGEILVEQGVVGPTELAEALQAQQVSRTTGAHDSTIRVDVGLLDKLMNLVGELVLARNQVLQCAGRTRDRGLLAAAQRLNLITTELQEGVTKTRMQPIGNIWGQFPRTVRDVALACGKKVVIEMEGKETELDKTIIETIKGPLTHLVRNSVDHGIEVPEARVKAGKNPIGRLILRAFHEGGQVIIEISDDGGGLDAERIRQKAVERGMMTAEQGRRMTEREVFNLIFLPGFSTASRVTNVSGRGVGMDVVRTNVERIGGTVDAQSTLGLGATVRIKIPLTLAIIPALIVTCAGDRYAIPQISLLELVRLEAGQTAKGVELVHGSPVYRLRGRLLPLVYLSQELKVAAELTCASKSDGGVNIVVLQANERQFGLVVDEINDSEEIVVKPLRKQLKTVQTFAGSTIMGDGRVALILDVLGLAQRAHVVTETHERALKSGAVESAWNAGKKQTFLLFAGPADSRMAIPLSALARLEQFPVEQLEMSGGQWVTQYRGQILPLIKLRVLLEERRSRPRALQILPLPGSAPIQVLVLNHEGQSIGLVVDRILDIVEDRAKVKMAATRPAVLYSVVIGERVTELLDVPAILCRAASTAKRSSAAIPAQEAVH